MAATLPTIAAVLGRTDRAGGQKSLPVAPLALGSFPRTIAGLLVALRRPAHALFWV